MNESIEIKNAGPIRHIKIDNIKPLTVLIGESGSGKSIIMKTIMLMRYVYKMMNIRSALKNSGITPPLTLELWHLLHDDMINYFGEGKSGEVTYSVDDKYSVSIINGVLDVSNAENIVSSDLLFLKESWITDMRSAIPMWINKRVPLPEAGFYFKETTDDFYKASSSLKEINLPYLGMNLEVKSDKDKQKIFLTPDDGSYHPIELQQTSSGMQTSAPLIMLAEYFANVFSFKDAIQRSIVSYLYQQDNLKNFRPDLEFSEMPKIVHMHIEKPELSLYPSAQCQMIDQLVGIMNSSAADRDLELMIATHSPYIINYLNVLLRRSNGIKDSQLGVYRIFDGELQNLLMTTQQGEKIVNTRDLTEPMNDILQKYRALNNR